MTDEPNDQEPVKTAIDLRIEQLESQMADMRATYESKILEYQQANKDLWAMAHPVQPSQPVTTQPEPPPEPSVKGFLRQFGIKEE